MSKLDSLEKLDKAQLGERWAKLTARPVPRVSAGLLRYALAWQLQAAVYGGLSPRTSQRLDQLAAGRTQTSDIRPGMQLVREYDGTLHAVTIGDDGAIEWDGRNWKSLSAVAREITGTRWSGPAFFGLKQKASAA